jgi:hypothetical protein
VLKKCLKGLGLRAVVLQKEVLITTADSEAAPVADVEDAHGGQDGNAAKKARPARAARAAQADRQLEQQIDQQAQQFIRQFAALHHAELFFLTEMCGTDPQIVAKLKENGDARVKAAARAYAATQQRMMRQPNERTGFADPRGLIQEEIHKELKSLASPEQLATYESQVARRAKARRSAAVRNLVSKLDRDLVLSAEQRAKLLETLLDRWDDSWGRVMQLFIYGDQYFPSVPDELVAPHLNATQMEIWRSIPKHNQSIFFSGLGLMGNEIEDFPWDGEAALNEANGAVRVEAVEAVETAVPDKEEAGGAP